MAIDKDREVDQQKLTQQVIVTEAIRLLNDEGLDGVSLRKLADRLGVKAPSLYWHFKDKDALLAAANERLFMQCLEELPEIHDWQRWMREFGLSMWRTQQSIRDFGRLVTTTRIELPQLKRNIAQVRRRVAGLDLPEDEAMEFQSAVQALITGWSAFAHAPYAPALGRIIDFDRLVVMALDALIAGKAQQVAAAGARKRRRRAAASGARRARV